ncbi:hypothetical protein HK098_003565 [Nowakowskiella sp. JEL0407]|nr:hypothetical protein HK098_003565 [Nowakowskiella sp. JEL0407]
MSTGGNNNLLKDFLAQKLISNASALPANSKHWIPVKAHPPPLVRSYSLPAPVLDDSYPEPIHITSDDVVVPESVTTRRRNGVCITPPNSDVRLSLDDIRIFYSS